MFHAMPFEEMVLQCQMLTLLSTQISPSDTSKGKTIIGIFILTNLMRRQCQHPWRAFGGHHFLKGVFENFPAIFWDAKKNHSAKLEAAI